MPNRNLRGVDLNLLVTLQALLVHRSVSRAAESLGRNQPSLSKDLAKLRRMLDDPLLVRSRGGLVPTPYVDGIGGALTQALDALDELVTPARFEPRSARGLLRIGLTDFEATLILPKVLRRVHREAPALRFDLVSDDAANLRHLETGALDLAILAPYRPAPNLMRRKLLSDRYLCMAPLQALPLTLERYLAARHVVVGSPDASMPNAIDAALARNGLQRLVAARAPGFLAAVRIAAECGYVYAGPATFLGREPPPPGHKVVPLPLAVAGWDVSMYWHQRRDRDPLCRWFRAIVVDEVRRSPWFAGGGSRRRAAPRPPRARSTPSAGA